ncbi:VOC family protein [Photobacterium sp. SDRW27]|uniref:VOC family protein n=1 Tax=Photobacterium obscurum TaxID=2829490 RepID=UPI00224302E1|nr:VOC family protein [Photobacterium obscurum]MCW8331420.1 VOC family protein [Photobacterium obscurum]
MKSPLLAPAFCQIAWVVNDISAAEKFFVETVGIEKFYRMENLSAVDTAGTYLGKPADWVFHLYIAYAGDTQIELIQPISGVSMFDEALEKHGNSVQHIAYWLDDSEYDAAAKHMEDAGYPLIQDFKLPILRVGYFDTREAIGVVTEIIGSSEEGFKFRQDLKNGNF